MEASSRRLRSASDDTAGLGRFEAFCTPKGVPAPGPQRAGTPTGVLVQIAVGCSGGVASLNHRLLAIMPSASNRLNSDRTATVYGLNLVPMPAASAGARGR